MKFCKYILIVAIATLTPLVLCSCSKGNDTPEWTWEDPKDPENPDVPDTEANPTIVAAGWANCGDAYGTLPSYINVYKSPKTLQTKNAIAYIAVADMNSAKFSVLGDAKGYNTPSELYAKDASSIIINGGYFWDGASLSMMCRDSKVLCPNNQVEGRSDWTVLYYPTRGIFSYLSDGTYQADWCYTTLAGTTYTYPTPAPNKSGSKPLATPSASYPTGASELKAVTAIGGGPVLVKGGVIKNTFQEELFDDESGIGAEINAPRTAIGITAEKKIILFVCEGRNMTTGVPGYTLADVAEIMKSLGCTEALNLDGGGSSCMLINGNETIKPSDGKQRSVVSAVGLK